MEPLKGHCNEKIMRWKENYITVTLSFLSQNLCVPLRTIGFSCKMFAISHKRFHCPKKLWVSLSNGNCISIVSTRGHCVSFPFLGNQTFVNQVIPLRMGTCTSSSCGHYRDAVSCSLSQRTMVTCITRDVPLQIVFVPPYLWVLLQNFLHSL